MAGLFMDSSRCPVPFASVQILKIKFLFKFASEEYLCRKKNFT